MGLSTHVLDTMHGTPAAGMAVALYETHGEVATLVKRFTLNADGTVDAGPKCSNFEKWKVTAVDRITIYFKSYDYENAEGGHFIYDFYYDGDKVVKLDWGDGIVGCYLRK